MPFAPAQRGLDGLDYAPAVAGAPLGGEADQPSLGPSHGVSHGDQTGWLQPPSEAPQLDMWGRLEQASKALRWTEHDRQTKCLRTRIVPPGQPVVIHRSENGRARYAGLVRCGHMTCPACGVARARDAAEQLGAVFERHLAPATDDDGNDANANHDAWMLTPTVPHYASTSTEDLVRVLFEAWAAFKRSRAWRRFAARWDIRGVVRVLDVKFSRRSNGPHPHFHVALLPRNARKRSLWTDEADAERIVRAVEPGRAFTVEEMAAEVDRLVHAPLREFDQHTRVEFLRELCGGLMPAWETAVLSVGGVVRNLGAFRDNGLDLTPGEKSASYFTAWGYADEVAGTSLKRETHLALLDRAAAGDEHAREIFLVWRRAVEGRAWVTGMADAMASVGVTSEDVAAFGERREGERILAESDAGRPVVFVPALRVEIPSYLWFEALTVGLGKLVSVVEGAADEPSARSSVLELLLDAPAALRRPRPPPG